jgi:rod shape-determining protein MreC
MAPPSNRRTGFSRKAQYTAFLGYAAGLLAAAVGLVLLAISIYQPAMFGAFRTAAADAAAPFGDAAASGRDAGADVFRTLAGYFESGAEHARLERELKLAKTRLVESQALKAENARLRDLLRIVREDGEPVAVTRLVSSTAVSTRRIATIGAGKARGVESGMPVRSRLGLVGRVIETGSNSSRVLLVSDSESLVPVRRATDGVAAFAQGRGDGTLRVRLVNLGINPLRVGDVMVTSGSGGLYRPNTPVAVIAEKLRDGAIARVLADPGATDFVIVESSWAPAAPSSSPAPPANSDGAEP